MRRRNVSNTKGAFLKAIWSSICIRDEDAAVCKNNKGVIGTK